MRCSAHSQLNVQVQPPLADDEHEPSEISTCPRSPPPFTTDNQVETTFMSDRYQKFYFLAN